MVGAIRDVEAPGFGVNGDAAWLGDLSGAFAGFTDLREGSSLSRPAEDQGE
jgi:hypothetical protein